MWLFRSFVLLLLVWGTAACGGASGNDAAAPDGKVADVLDGEVAEAMGGDVEDVFGVDAVDAFVGDGDTGLDELALSDVPNEAEVDSVVAIPEVIDAVADEVEWVEPQTAWQALESLVDNHLLGELPPAVSATEVYQNQQQDADYYYIIDVRPGTTFSSGHIPGAVNVSLGQIEAHVSGGVIPAGARVLVVCMAGQQSGWAVALLRLAGYDVFSLQWGMPAWTTAGGNMWVSGCSNQAAGIKESSLNEKDGEQPFPEFQGDPDDAEGLLAQRVSEVWSSGFKLKTYGSVKQSLDSYYIVAHVDAAEYLAGHLPGAVHYQPGEDLDDEADMAYLPTGKSILVYSCSGESSAAVAVHLNILGYDAYTLKFGTNGLWHDDLIGCKWSADLVQDYPVETGS